MSPAEADRYGERSQLDGQASDAANAEFQPLPEGALVASETLYITHVCSEAPDHNSYSVEELTPVLPCPNPACACADNPVGRHICEACGTTLEGVLALHRRYRLHEIRDYAAVESAADLSAREPRHTALVPFVYFSERPYGSVERHYVLEPDPLPVTLSDLPVPQKPARVLTWGVQLAEGLAFLHEQGVGWKKVDDHHIVVQDRTAMWHGLHDTNRLPEAPASAAQCRSRDVFDLAGILYHLASGLVQFSADTKLPRAMSRLFERVLTTQQGDLTARQLAHELQSTLDSLRRPTTLSTHVGRCTDVGLVRDLNEDSLVALELVRVRQSVNQSVILAAVADGMGGHSAGDIASGLAVDTLTEHMVTHCLPSHLAGGDSGAPLQPAEWLEAAVQATNRVVFERRTSAQNDMGTTLVAAVVVDDRAYLANVGDSRAYILNDSTIRRITTDHSLVERLVCLGHIDEREARTHPQRNVIYRTLGDKVDAEADYYSVPLQPGDKLLLCSDGLTANADDQAIHETTLRASSPQEACEQLVQLANDLGGQDNVTVILLQVE